MSAALAALPAAALGAEPGGAIPGVRLFEDALPAAHFVRLADAVAETGNERLKQTYTTTFWYPRNRPPASLVEECVAGLMALAEPGPDVVGCEWWLGRLRPGEKLRFHFDRDMTRHRQTGEYLHPLLSSVLYLNDFASSPTVILDQRLAADGRTRVPAKALSRLAVAPAANRYLVFPGTLRHGVRPHPGVLPAPADAVPRLRLSLLVNYWHTRPLMPVCRDYDGSVYPALEAA